MKLKALAVLVLVVTDHVPDVVVPTVTVALVTVLTPADEVCRIAMVSPEEKPATVVLPHEPLRAMAVQRWARRFVGRMRWRSMRVVRCWSVMRGMNGCGGSARV